MPLAPSPNARRNLVAWSVAAGLVSSLVGIGSAPSPALAGGGVIEVTTTDDELNTDGDCSLREAVVAANTDAPVDACPAGMPANDVIELQPTTYTLSIPGRDEDAAATGDLDITARTAITTVNLGRDGVATIDGGGVDRVFDARPDVFVGFAWIVIRGGDAADGAGGGVRLSDSACDAFGNPRYGGSFESLVVRDNTAHTGGGIHVGACRNPRVVGVSIVGNHATQHGGGISAAALAAVSPTVSTISGNSAGAAGGGLWIDGSGTLSHVTVAANTSPDGAGLWTASPTTVDAVIVADNDGANCSGETYPSAMSDDLTCAGPHVSDAGLQPLTQIGDLFVHPLEPSSPAVDFDGPPFPTWCSSEWATDQVGTPWPLDGDGDGQAWCDYGAVEAAAVSAEHVQITVTTTDDEVNADGDCSLREAVIAANTNSAVDACPAGRPLINLYVNADEIVVPGGVYQLVLPGSGEDAGASGDLDITEAVRIRGMDGPVIDAGGIDRVFDIMAGVDTELAGLSIVGGHAGPGDGGGIRLGDSSCLDGGSIQVSTVLRQVVLEDNAAARGGGVHVADCVYLFMAGSSVTANTASTGGGASVIGRGQLTATDSTFSGNRAEVAGGAAWAELHGARFDYVTIAGNRAPSGAAVWFAGPHYEGGGQYVAIADNDGPACVGVGALHWSVADDASCGGAEVVEDVQLGPATQAGRMIVHVPEASSPVIDVDDEFPCGAPYAPTDQLGSARPQDGDGDGTATCDAGAIEVEGIGPTLPDTAMRAP